MMIIHIGMPKTGTTFLQQGLFGRKDKLLEKNALYLSTNAALSIPPPAQHHYLAHGLMNTRRRHTPQADFGLLDAHVEGLKREIKDHPSAVPILSSESFFGFRGSHIAALRALFPEKDVKIIVYLRRQDLWVDSFFSQVAKGARNGSPEGVYAAHKWHLNYGKLLASWAQYYGEENIIVRPYERFASGMTDMWRDFFTAIGLPAAAGVAPPVAAANVAVASREVMLFLKNQHIYGDQPQLRKMFRRIDQYRPKDKSAKFVSTPLAERILSELGESNAAVARRYLKRDRLFLEDAIPEGPHVAELSVDHVTQFLGGASIELLGRIDGLVDRVKVLEKRVEKLSKGERWSIRDVMRRLTKKAP